VDDAASLMSFSGRGPVVDTSGQRVPWIKPDVVAPGAAVRSAHSSQAALPTEQGSLVPAQLPIPGGAGVSQETVRYVELSGTSQAAPHVAGVAALMLEANPALTPAQVHDLLRESAIDVGTPGPDDTTGWGLVDARDAVRRALDQPEDHGNVLLAGGEEAYDARGQLAGVLGQVVQTEPALDVKPAGSVEARFPVKPGADHVAFRFTSSPATGAFRVYLDGPSGAIGPWTNAHTEGGSRVQEGGLSNPRAGMYKLRASPVGPVSGEYAAHIVVNVKPEALPPAAELPPGQRAPQPVSGPLEQVGQEVQWELERFGRAVHRAVPAPELGLAGMAVAAVAILAGRRSPR